MYADFSVQTPRAVSCESGVNLSESDTFGRFELGDRLLWKPSYARTGGHEVFQADDRGKGSRYGQGDL